MKARPARAIAVLVLAVLAGAAAARPTRQPPPPTGELLLDIDDPVIEVRIGQVPLRLRVELDSKNLIELNPAAADRLAADPPDRTFRFEDGFEAVVGRTTLKGIETAAPITINGRNLIVLVASHGRDCCAGVYGEIGMGLLPYATIRFVRRGTHPDADRNLDFLLDDNSEHGPQTMVDIGKTPIFLQFSFDRPDSVATASAGVILARAYGGQLAETGPTIAAFGIPRPTAILNLPRPVALAGFRYEKLAVRTADFAGRYDFPEDNSSSDDIVVRHKVAQQEAWPVVLIGRDRMDGCSEALFDSIAHRLTLRCSFARES